MVRRSEKVEIPTIYNGWRSTNSPPFLALASRATVRFNHSADSTSFHNATLNDRRFREL